MYVCFHSRKTLHVAHVERGRTRERNSQKSETWPKLLFFFYVNIKKLTKYKVHKNNYKKIKMRKNQKKSETKCKERKRSDAVQMRSQWKFINAMKIVKSKATAKIWKTKWTTKNKFKWLHFFLSLFICMLSMKPVF